MSEAFTVRLRVRGGRHAFWLAPAGGMGLSYPCCADGHTVVAEALAHGVAVLGAALQGSHPTTTVLAS